jgi:S-adenosylmethionine synthetase
VSEAALEEALPKVMDLTPRGIRTHLDLNRPIYARTAAYGHFGRRPAVTDLSPGRNLIWSSRSSKR